MAARWVEEARGACTWLDLNGAFAGEPVNGAAVRDHEGVSGPAGADRRRHPLARNRAELLDAGCSG